MFLADQMPDPQQYEHTWQRVQAMYEYMYGLKNKLNLVLSNIGEENLSQDLTETLERMRKATDDLATKQLTSQAAKLAAWPVGAVYMAAEDAKSPELAIGGKWTKLDSAPMTGVSAWKRTE